ncbi:YD repeat-containing protein [Cladorrhinum sp. PSN259]|nr:YD repeat-containing protein [Cladorrhinum sp. PSN259]
MFGPAKQTPWQRGAGAPPAGHQQGAALQQPNASQSQSASVSANDMSNNGNGNKASAPMGNSPFSLPSITLPKAGGSVGGMGEKFAVNAATGTASITIPVATSPGRNGNGVQLALSYDSGAGNGPFGMGWSLSTPSIRRKTDKGIPRYVDARDMHDSESDVFLAAGAEDLVPVLEWSEERGGFASDRRSMGLRCEGDRRFHVFAYRPRIEGSFQRILRIADAATGETHCWEVTAPDNSTTVFGDSDNCRISDPSNPKHVFEWLPSSTFDERGNFILFTYKKEDSAGVATDAPHEAHRKDKSRTAHRYLKSIKYGNTVSRVGPQFVKSGTDWLFEVVFDYGEHHDAVPLSTECRPWPCRADPFSSYRAGFETRQYRLCRRVLMFHHFPDEPAIGRDCLVASLEPCYRAVGANKKTGLAITTVLESIGHLAWRRRADGGYDKGGLPPLEFTYSEAAPAKVPAELDSHFLANLPVGFNDTTYQLVDLESQGLPGAVSRVDGSLLYVPNNGHGQFGPAETLLSVPASVFSSAAKASWIDLAGEGKVELVRFDGPSPGFYKRNWDEPGGWDSFRPFEMLPNIAWGNADLKFIDVTGDGLADAVMLDDNLICVYRSRGDEGFDATEYLHPPLDEDSGPRLLFSGGVDTIYAADMTGDGLSDLVRIRQGEVAYWPNFGYGRFGSKVVMENAPAFDFSNNFDQSLLRLADVDGSGVTDLVYLGGETPTMYLNLSGNGWSDGTPIHGFPSVNAETNVQVLDLLGKGTACLVWSSALPGDAQRQIRYLDLMEQGKPYLLTAMENNMGSEHKIFYTSSSEFYARDKKAGRSWISHLPFPVQCVESSQTVDRINGNIFTTRYAYHDGYFDGPEREYRGFGMVETWDTEHYANLDDNVRQQSNIDPVSHIPPILTKTWYHTGLYHDDRCLASHYRQQYFADDTLHPGLAEMQLAETLLPTSLQVPSHSVLYIANYQEHREAYRALKGATLRSEVYSLDGTHMEPIPVTVSQANFTIEQLQPLGGNKHAIFIVHPKEAVQMEYDRKLYSVGARKLLDPRVEHSMTLETDCFGHPLRTMAINYGRRYGDSYTSLTDEDRERQRRTFAMLTETSYTNMIDTETTYVLPLVAETSVYEVVNLLSAAKHGHESCRWADFNVCRRLAGTLSSGKFDIPFENFDGPYPSSARPYRRMTKKSRSIYKRDDLTGPLPLGIIEPMMLAWKNHNFIFTDKQVQSFVDSGKLKKDEVEALFRVEGAYTRFPDEQGWWSDTGLAFYSPNRDDSAEEELLHAKEGFYLFRRTRTPWDTDQAPAETIYAYDKYQLLVQSVTDPYNNIVSVGERDKDSGKLIRYGYDYRLLIPFVTMDENRNRNEVVYDLLGKVTATAARGKPEDHDGDDVGGAATDVSEKNIKSFFQAPRLRASDLLGTATSRVVYDMHTYFRTKQSKDPQPNWISTIARETHESDLEPGAGTRTFVGFSYLDGGGQPIQAKSQCEPGPLEPSDALEAQTKKEQRHENIVQHRWLTSSWVINNNKGDPVRSYEPFFSDTHHFQDKAIHGVSPIFVYDSLSRTVAIINPNHTWTKSVFSPWGLQAWDKTDTVLISDPAQDPDVGGFIRRLPKNEYLPTWYDQRKDGQLGAEEAAAAQASAHSAATPSVSFNDAMGRECARFEILRSSMPVSNKEAAGGDRILRQATYLDIQSLPYKVIDTEGRTASLLRYCFAGEVVHERNMDTGDKWSLKAVDGSMLRAWNGRGQVFRSIYDSKRRVRELHVQDGEIEYLTEKTEFGDKLPDAEGENARQRIVAVFDQSGVTRTPAYDFRGRVVQSTRQLVAASRGIVDWGGGDIELAKETYEERIRNDARGNVVWTRLPDGTETVYTYNDRNLQQTVTTTLCADAATKQDVIKAIFYDAKGQRTRVVQGNGVEIRASYDKLTFKTRRISTTRLIKRRRGSLRRHSSSGRGSSSSGSESESSSGGSSGSPRHHGCHRRRDRVDHIQEMSYVYDATGNITHIQDSAKQAVFFRGHRVDASQSFTYDSIYRLEQATGREHVGQMAAGRNASSADDTSQPSSDHGNNGKALARYVEWYRYDSQGNILSMHHQTCSESREWTRVYEYDEPSAIIPLERSNRLSRTRVGRKTEEYHYAGPAGISGCMTRMPGRPSLEYDYSDRMVASISTQKTQGSAKEGPDGHAADNTTKEQTLYRYDATGMRVRKVTERVAADGRAFLLKETIYIGGAFQVLRRFDVTSGEAKFELHSLSIAESGRPLLLIDHRVLGPSSDNGVPATVYRYQLSNHQGSTATEVDQDARILSHEEYTPYGVSALRFAFRQTEAPKRYRFLGKELDDGTGFYHLGARYYAAWLGRFTTADPLGHGDGLNVYQYAQSNPVMLVDPGGTAVKLGGGVDPETGFRGEDLMKRRRLAAQGHWAERSKTRSPRSIRGSFANVWGDRAEQDFALWLKNQGHAGAQGDPLFSQRFGTALKGSSEIDILFKKGEAIVSAWEHKLVSVNTYFNEAGEQTWWGTKFLDKRLASWEKQYKNAKSNLAGLVDDVHLGVTLKGLPEESKGFEAMKKAVEAKFPGRLVEVVAEDAEKLVGARGQLNKAAGIAMQATKDILVASPKLASGLKVAGKVLGAGLGVVAVAGVLLTANDAKAATTGTDILGGEKAIGAGEKFSTALDVGNLGLTAASKLGVVAAGSAGAVVASIVVGGAAAGAAVGTAVQEALKEPLGEGGAAATGVLAGAATGAVIGAVLGSAVPGVGTVVGAAVGGAAGAVGAAAKMLLNKYW